MVAGRDSVIWCAGLPFKEERRLRQDEQDKLKRMGWRLFGQGIGSFFAVAVFGTLLLVSSAYLSTRGDGALIALTILFVMMLLFLPATLFAREGWMQRGLRLLRDARRGYARVFEGTLSDNDLLQTEDAADASQQRLLALGLLSLGEPQMQRVEVLPISRRVWRVGDGEVQAWVEAISTAVSAVPDAACLWLHPNNDVILSGLTRRRRLSDHERKEVRRAALYHWLRPAVPAFFFTLWLSVIVFLAVTTHPIPKTADWNGILHLALIAFATDAFFVSRWLRAWQIYHDARVGEVLIVVDATPLDGESASATSETLPFSGLCWTQSGKPAAWRRMRK